MDLSGLIGRMKEGQSAQPEPVYQKLGQNVARIREQKGLSQGDLAEQMGKGLSTVAEIETGATRILVSDVEKLAEMLGVEPRVLMQGIWF